MDRWIKNLNLYLTKQIEFWFKFVYKSDLLICILIIHDIKNLKSLDLRGSFSTHTSKRVRSVNREKTNRHLATPTSLSLSLLTTYYLPPQSMHFAFAFACTCTAKVLCPALIFLLQFSPFNFRSNLFPTCKYIIYSNNISLSHQHEISYN